MVLEGGRDEKEPRGDLRERDPLKIAPRGELLAIEVPLHAHPIIKRLQGQMDVLIGFYFDDGEPAVAIDAQQIDDAALAGGKLRDLSIERRRVNHRVEGFDLRAHLR